MRRDIIGKIQREKYQADDELESATSHSQGEHSTTVLKAKVSCSRNPKCSIALTVTIGFKPRTHLKY